MIQNKFALNHLLLRSFVWLFCAMLFSGCRNNLNKVGHAKYATVKTQTVAQTLSYSGRIQPLDSMYIGSPASGYVQKMSFSYGDQVKKDQVLFTISAPKIESNFVDKVIGFLKAKDALTQAKRKLNVEKDMYKAGIVAKDDYIKDETNYENAYIDFAKSTIALRQVAQLVDASFADIKKLTLADLTKIEKLLVRQSFVSVRAKRSGRIMSPSVVQSTAGSSKKLVTVGSKIDKGQMLAVSVRETGYKVDLVVSEDEINHIKQGMKVDITSGVLDKRTIAGHVAEVHIYNMQKAASGAQMVFPISIRLDHLTAQDLAKIYLGMQVKVKIYQGQTKQKTVPINAVFSGNNRYWVQVKKPNNQMQKIYVTTGVTTAQDVVVEGDLSVGAKVMLHD